MFCVSSVYCVGGEAIEGPGHRMTARREHRTHQQHRPQHSARTPPCIFDEHSPPRARVNAGRAQRRARWRQAVRNARRSLCRRPRPLAAYVIPAPRAECTHRSLCAARRGGRPPPHARSPRAPRGAAPTPRASVPKHILSAPSDVLTRPPSTAPFCSCLCARSAPPFAPSLARHTRTREQSPTAAMALRSRDSRDREGDD